MANRRIHRKFFSCGHRGKGQACHQCQQGSISSPLPAIENFSQTLDRQAWRQSFEADPINLRGLPKHVVKKSRWILQELSQGTPLHRLGARRFRHDRTQISIPVTQRYRMLCHDVDGSIVPRAVMPHETYNSIASNTKR